MFDRMTSYGNGNKANMRVAMLESLLATHEGEGSSARVNSLKQVIKRNKTEMADDAPSSLDLMRIIFQNEITRELHQIMERHVRTTFSPAIENLKKNGHEVDEEVINDLYISILEAAKKPFIRQDSSKEHVNNGNDVEVVVQTSRRLGSNDSSMSTASDVGARSIASIRKEEQRFQVDLTPYTPQEVAKWNPERFGLTTLFVPANRVASLTLQSMTAFFAQHSRMFRYSCDEGDKQTLREEIGLQMEPGRCYLVCLEDAREFVGRSPELEQNSFCLKEPMLLKIRRFASPFYLRLRQRSAQQQKQQPQQSSPWNFNQ